MQQHSDLTPAAAGVAHPVLAGRRVLLIGIGFYDYEAAICGVLEAGGAEVTYLIEEPPPPSLLHRRFNIGIKDRLRRHHAALLTQIRALPALDDIVVIKARTLTPEFVAELRAAHPGAQLIGHHWDSLRRSPEILALVPQFDRLLTFDHRDAAANPGFIHRPNFVRPEMTAYRGAPAEIELSFVGWLHHDRLAYIEAIRDLARKQGWRFEPYLSTGAYTAFRQGRLAGRDFVHGRRMSFDQYARLVGASMAVLDLPHPDQAGLTLCCLEVVTGAGRKLLTTNADVVGYDFYDPEMIRVIDMNRPDIPEDFLRGPRRPVPAEIAARYSIENWVLDVLEPARLAEAPPFFVDPAGRR